MIRTILGAAVLVGAAACGAPSATGAQEAPTTEPTTSMPAPEPSPTPSGPSIEQFASLVAEHHADWDAQVATVEENCDDPELAVACVAGYLTLGFKGLTINLVLAGAHDPATKGYLGDPPPEIADLLAETESAAAAVTPAYDAFSDAGCKDLHDMDCFAESIKLKSAVDDVSRQLDAWAPYS